MSLSCDNFNVHLVKRNRSQDLVENTQKFLLLEKKENFKFKSLFIDVSIGECR
jgi:hypothetical protein